MIVGYARTSTVEQKAGFEAQIKKLQEAGCERIFSEQVSSISDREQMNHALEFVREGDVFVVTALDRLARSVVQLMKVVEDLERKKVSLRILGIGIDTATPTGRMMLTMLGSVAEFERSIMIERQKEGIAKAKAEGRFRGRPPMKKEIRDEIIKMGQTRIPRRTVAETFGVSEVTVYKILREHQKSMSC